MKNFFYGLAIAGVILNLGLSFMVLAQTGDEPGDMPPPGQPPVSKQEIKDFSNEMKNIAREAQTILKQMAKAKGYDEQKAILTDLIKQTSECVGRLSQAPSDEKREVIDECRSSGFWDSMNEVRESFVPPQEIKNALNEIKRQTAELNKFKKQLAKSGSASLTESIDTLIASLAERKNQFATLTGQDLREAMRDFWDAQIWDEVNKIRSKVELPKQLKQIEKELNGVKKLAAQAKFKKVAEFVGLDYGTLNTNITAREEVIKQIYAAIDGSGDDANELMNDNIYQGWHPGDLRNLLDMLRETYDRMRQVKDEEIKNQVMAVLAPIVESANAGEYRDARDAMVQFSEQMRKFDYLFHQGYNRGIDKKAQQGLDKLEQLINSKLQKEFEVEEGRPSYGSPGGQPPMVPTNTPESFAVPAEEFPG